MTKKLTTEEFVQKATEKHGDTYDYSNVEYTNSTRKITIICKLHGAFEQTPSCHLYHGCQKCARNVRPTTEEFIQRAIEKHGDTYDYSKVKYNGKDTKVIIICKRHGEFQQTPRCHLKVLHGCPKCAVKHIVFTKNARLSTDLNTIWKTIPEHPKYEVSSNGEIRNKQSKHCLSLRKDHCGYLTTYLYSDYLKVDIRESNPDYLKVKLQAKMITERVHRVVASTFLENPNKLPTVNHKNHKRDDNRVENLEWASYSDQNKHKIGSQTNSCARRVYRKDIKTGAILQEYRSIIEATKWLKDHSEFSGGSHISSVCNGKRNFAYGFVWSYVDPTFVDNEEWKPISNEYTNGVANYFISNKGRIKFPNNRISDGTLHGGYKNASIQNYVYRMHRLVALTFLPNPNNYLIVNHIDGNKTNNIVENLEWCSQSQNCQHAYDTKLNPTSIKIKLVEHNLEFSSCAKAGEWIKENTQFKKASGSMISTGMKKGQKKVYGFTWKYIE